MNWFYAMFHSPKTVVIRAYLCNGKKEILMWIYFSGRVSIYNKQMISNFEKRKLFGIKSGNICVVFLTNFRGYFKKFQTIFTLISRFDFQSPNLKQRGHTEMPIYAHLCPSMPIHAHPCPSSRIMADTNVFWCILMYSTVFWCI